MSDIKTFWGDFVSDFEIGRAGSVTVLETAKAGEALANEPLLKWVQKQQFTGDLSSDSTLKTAVIISLFTDRLAEEDDRLEENQNRRGWWADAYPETANDKIGSRLWLLSREKTTQHVLNRAEEYAEESLQWLLDQGIASEVQVIASYVKQGVLGLAIIIDKPAALNNENFNFEYVWNQ